MGGQTHVGDVARLVITVKVHPHGVPGLVGGSGEARGRVLLVQVVRRRLGVACAAPVQLQGEGAHARTVHERMACASGMDTTYAP